jgi:LemA protein
MRKFAFGCGGIILILVFIAVVLTIAAMGKYNTLVKLDQSVDQSWAQVQNVYQRRADLIPNLVNTVQGAANFEKSTLVAVTEARASVGRLQINQNQAPATAEQLEQFQAAQGQLGNALSRLLVVAERYPELKANANFQQLQAQLEGTENRIAVERRTFNQTVQEYNTAVRSFPTFIYAGLMGFHAKPYFSAKAGAENAPTVNFNFGNASPAPSDNLTTPAATAAATP